MSLLVITISLATDLGVKKILRTHGNFYSEVLAPQYTVGCWLTDRSVDLEIKRFLYSLATHAPYLEGIEDSTLIETFNISEFYFEGEKAEGLGIAWLMESIAISLHCGGRWAKDLIEVTVEMLDDNGEVERKTVGVNHASSPENIGNHRSWILNQIKANITDGRDMMDRKINLFPSLIFCGNTEKILSNLKGSDPLFRQITKRLFELKEFCSVWVVGDFDKNKILSKVNPESPETLAKYKKEHTFVCDNGDAYIFSWHVYITPGPWRIYFYPISSLRKIFIGYIGKKLPCVNYPTV